MKTVRRVLATLVALVLIFFAIQIVASESGEVVVLTTTNGDGEHTTRLWVVDHDGDAWLRSGTGSTAGWYQRILREPSVEVARDGVTARYRAEPTPAARAEINRLMHAKYGWRDTFVGALGADWESAIPVRLVPMDQPQTG